MFIIKTGENMNISDFIDHKKRGGSLSAEEISLIVSLYNNGKITDGKMLEFLSCITEHNFSYDETYYLADAMASTGEKLNLASSIGVSVDKHSAGSYSDATTLIFMSVLSALGVKNVKSMSSLYGDFNNSIDRLKVFKGFNADISKEKLLMHINKTGVGILEEGDKIAPIDKRIYKLSRRFGISSIPLSAASIIAKKIAMGASAVVYDVKVGEGAMFGSFDYAETFANFLVETSKRAGFVASAVISNLDQPLGSSVGARMEVEEAIFALRSEQTLYGSKLIDVAKELVVNALLLVQAAKSRTDAAEMFDNVISDGSALKKFTEIVSTYGGEYIDFKSTPEKLLSGVAVTYLSAHKSGYLLDTVISKLIEAYDTLAFKNGKLIDSNAGFVLLKREGDKIELGDKIARIFYNIQSKNLPETLKMLEDAFIITESKVKEKKILYKVVL